MYKNHVETKLFQLITENHTSKYTMTNMEKSMGEIMKIIDAARRRVGLFPININHIKRYIDTVGDSDDVIYKHERFDMARRCAANEFLVKELGFKDKEVRIKDCKMANNPESSILWIETDIDQVKNIFMKAAITANRKISVMQYYPRILWERKKSLEKRMSVERVKDRKLRYQIRLGVDDIELLTKAENDKFYVKVDVETYGGLSDIDYIDNGPRDKRDGASENDKL